jgi:N-acetylglucosamine-6-phosphate deacetylase
MDGVGEPMIIQGRTSLSNEIKDCQVIIEETLIADVITDASSFVTPDLEIGAGNLLCPGFMDPQINGGFGKEFKTDSDAIEAVTRDIVQYGVTSIVPTVTTMKMDSYEQHIGRLMQSYSGPVPNARVLGIHLEGPVLNPAKRGAHPEEYLLAPDDLVLDSYILPGVKMVTLAPELPGGWSLYRNFVDLGLKVGIGHSLAGYDEVVENVDQASTHIVHIYNAMGDFSGRNPGLIGTALDCPDLNGSLIADLVHVHPAALRAAWSAHNGRRLFGVSDGSAVLGLPVGEHQIGARKIERQADRAVLSGTSTLVGSVLTMNVAAKNIMAVTGCKRWEAVNFVTANTAEYLDVFDEFGSIERGKFADLCVVDDAFEVLLTVVGGTVVFDRLS